MPINPSTGLPPEARYIQSIRMTLDNWAKIGIMGYSPPNTFDTVKADRMLKAGLVRVQTQLSNAGMQIAGVVIVSGWTNLGMPAVAYAMAARNKLITAGIACAKRKDFDCYPCMIQIEAGHDWGDESPTFLQYCDAFIRVGGGKQSLAECAAAKKLGKPVIEYELPVL